MPVIDYFLLAVVAISALIGLLRGFIKEALSLAVWIGAVWCAARFGAMGATWMPSGFEDPVTRLWGGRVLIFVVVLFGGSILSWLAGYLARQSVITGADRALGTVFGLGRGIVVAGLAVLGLQLAGFAAEPWWPQSKLIPYAAAVGNVLRNAAEEQLDHIAGRLKNP